MKKQVVTIMQIIEERYEFFMIKFGCHENSRSWLAVHVNRGPITSSKYREVELGLSCKLCTKKTKKRRLVFLAL